MQSAFATHQGQRRQNQDNGLIDGKLGLYAVADGVGGGDSGEIASASVCMQLHQMVSRGGSLTDAINGCHLQLMQDHAGGERGYAASTVVVAREAGHRLRLSWVGDSRIYLHRQGKLEQLSEDHSLVQKSNHLTKEESVAMRHVLTQAVGAAGEEGLQVDCLDVDREKGDRWLLCSDGLHGVVSLTELEELMGSNKSVQEIADTLIQRALDNDADDNVTVVVMLDDQPIAKAEGKLESVESRPALTSYPVEPEAPQKPWHYMVLGGVLALMLFLALIWGL